MSEKTKIQWCDHTFNPWIGCTKVSPGCTMCYAEVSTPSRVRGIEWGAGKTRQRTSPANWKEPLRWNKAAAGKAIRPRVFCASLSDWLDDEVPIEWLADLIRLIYDTPHLDWLLLTKRPENFFSRMRAAWDVGVDHGAADAWLWNWMMSKTAPANVWIGTTAEDQLRADQRLPELIKIPAVVRFVSVEPMLGVIDFTSHFLRARGGLHWAIFGGESGRNARHCDVGWIRSAGTQCRIYHVAPFVKQLGANATIAPQGYDPVSGALRSPMPMFGIKDPKGGEPSEWPEDLRVREFPKMNVLLCPQNLH